MPVGNKYVSTDPVINWTPDGSTTVIDVSAFGRNFSWTRSAADIDAGGYGDASVVHLVGKLDVGASMDVLYEDGYVIEDTFVPGSKGTLDHYPLGNSTGKRKRTMIAQIGTADINEPHDDVASGTVEFRNASSAGMTTSLVA